MEKLYSELEEMVMYDMIINGFDPTNTENVIKYWSEKLD